MFYLLLFLAAALSRLIPHPPNVTAIVATATIAGAYLSPRWAWTVPLAALLATDVLFLEPYGVREMAFIYGGHAIAILIGLSGSWLFVRTRRDRRDASRSVAGLKTSENGVRSLLDGYALCGAAGAAGFAFWVVSNFGIWLGWYPQTPEGLASCYWLALPFLGNQLAGDLLFTGGLFLAVEACRGALGPAWMGWGRRSR